MTERKEKLIAALKEEREWFFEKGNSTEDHDAAIRFLETNEWIPSFELYDLAWAAKDDFETLCADYGV